MKTARPLLLCAMFAFLFAAPDTNAAPLFPTSYDMLNGSGERNDGKYNYWDSSYSGKGSTGEDNASLSVGLGDLTDGVIADSNWYRAENPEGTGPYVGWRASVNKNPLVTFRFAASTLLDSVTIFVDDSNGEGGVSTPESVDIGIEGGKYTNFITVDPKGAAPTSYTFSNLALTGSAFDVRFNNANDWIFLSEVQFDGRAAAVPEPATYLLSAVGLIALGLVARCRRVTEPSNRP